MPVKRILQWAAILSLVLVSFSAAGGASASSPCASQITVQWGDTLGGIALLCGTTVDAIRAANPGLGWTLYVGQVLYIPTGYGNPPVPQPSYGKTYTVQWGDTLGKIAARTGTSVSKILAVNPQIYNPSLIYAGQVINLPSGVSVPPGHYPPPTHPTQPPPTHSFSTLKIDYKYGMYVRSAPGGSIIASALDDTTWFYRKNSIFVDNKWKVWVEVKLFPPVKGYTTGWLLVKDQLGTYFTDPQLGR